MECSPITMFPVEVLENILQDLDRTSVKNCSLVSHTFHSLARPILFQKVTLSLEPDPEATFPPDFTRTRNAQFFKFIVEDANVASFIRELSLDERQIYRSGKTSDDWQTNADNLILLLPKLTRLKHLSVLSHYFRDWTMYNDNLRAVIWRLFFVPHSLQLSSVCLQKEEALLLTSIPKLVLITIADPPLGRTSTEVSTPSSSLPSSLLPNALLQLQDLTIVPRNPADVHSVDWSIMQVAGSNLTSLQIYSSPYFDCTALSWLDRIDLRRHPSLLSLAISISLTCGGFIEKVVSLFSQLCTGESSSSSKIKRIEMCCDVDLFSFPSQDTLDRWNWGSLDAILSSNTYKNLGPLEITVRKAIRSRTSGQRQRKYKDLEPMVVELFRNRLPVVSEMVLVIAGPAVEGDR